MKEILPVQNTFLATLAMTILQRPTPPPISRAIQPSNLQKLNITNFRVLVDPVRTVLIDTIKRTQW